MAITNAQQYQQLVNKPANGKRPGYRGDYSYGDSSAKGYDPGGGKASKGSGVSTSSGGYAPTSQAAKGTGGYKAPTYTGGADNYQDVSTNKNNVDIAKKEKKKYQKQFTSKGKAPPGPDQKKRQRALDYVNRGLSRYFDRFEEYYDEDDFGITKTGYPNFGFPNIYDAIGDELTARKNIKEIKKTGNKIPVGISGNSYELSAIPDLDIDSIRELAATQTLAQGAPLTGYQANALEDLKRNIENRDTFLETGDTSVIYPDPPEATNTGPDPDPVDPCLGPNPPAYCNVGNDDDDDTTTPTRNLGGLAPRFMGSIFDFDGMADGGRAGAMDGGRMRQMEMMEDEDDPTGGIMDLESGRQMYFLGKLVKKAGRAIKKVVKSPIGKAALLYGLGSLGAGALGKYNAGTGSGFFSGLKGKLFGKAALGAKSVPGMGSLFKPATKGLLGKLGITKGAGSFMPTLKGGIGLGLGIPFALDALGVGKEEDDGMDLDEYYKTQGIDIDAIRNNPNRILARRFMAEGGDAEPVAKKTMPLLDMDGMEKDYRADGGFVPIGRMERADDVPARLSKNEFVFTADAVRNAGEGDIDKGAEVMYNMMKNLESGGEVSEESQGLDGAKEMFQTSKRLEEVL